MSRSYVSAQCESVASYMDGVQVKIAEAYKPPRKVGLPTVYTNKLPDLNKFNYEFHLEKSVLEKIREWRQVRQANIEARNIRLEEKRKNKLKETPPPLPSPSDIVNQMPVEVVSASKTILMPQPLSPSSNELQHHVKENGLDYADFDNDTSSPFDNMELKTINDMEELAQVLQPNTQVGCWTTSAAELEDNFSELIIDSSSEVEEPKEMDKQASAPTTISSTATTISAPTTMAEEQNKEDQLTEVQENRRTVSDIIQDLQRELARPVSKENWRSWTTLESPESDVRGVESVFVNSNALKQSKLVNPLPDLMEDDQKLAKHLNDMGFPLPRAARAIRDLGSKNNKKVVEYLLAVQSLEDVGIPGDDAERALTLVQYDQTKAKVYYENLCILRDLGFPEDQASAALLKCDIDRDKALDLLIA